MSLIQCPECGDSVSDLAVACPHCGNPVSAPAPAPPKSGKYAAIILILVGTVLAVFSPTLDIDSIYAVVLMISGFIGFLMARAKE